MDKLTDTLFANVGVFFIEDPIGGGHDPINALLNPRDGKLYVHDQRTKQVIPADDYPGWKQEWREIAEMNAARLLQPVS